jgi:hypothetical protein
VGVVRNALVAQANGSEPATRYINALFGDPANPGNPFGPTVLLQKILLNGTTDATQQAVINGFFTTGILGVIHNLLVPPAAPGPASTMALFKAATITQNPTAVSGDDNAPVDGKSAQDVGAVTTGGTSPTSPGVTPPVSSPAVVSGYFPLFQG